MDVTYSLLVAVVVSFLLIFTKFAIIRWVYTCVTWLKNMMYLRSLPSPPRRWLLGHALELASTEKSLTYMQENHKKYSKLCVYWIGPFFPLVYTGDVETMKVFLHQSGEAPKPRLYRFVQKWSGDGLSLSSGKKWKNHRKLLTPTFHFDMLKQYVPVYNEASDKLLEKWSSFADSGESVNITQYTKSLSMEVLLKCMYSNSDGCLDNTETSIVVATETLFSLLADRLFSPYYAFDWIYFSTAAGRKFLHYCDIVHKFSDDVIIRRRKELLQEVEKSQPSKKYQDFVDILLSIKDENGEGLTDIEIRDELDTFITAGHHTVATAIGWCLYCLAKYKEQQEICRKEIRDILTGRDSATITWEDLSKLNYITMCIKETLRLYTIIPFIGKLSSEDVVVNGYRIPKGTFVGVGLDAMHHDPRIWSDPEKFDPMRFTADNCKNRDNFTFLAFSAGPRNCIGQRFALHELKVTLANILNRFYLELDTTHEVQPYYNGFRTPRNGIKLKFSSAV